MITVVTFAVAYAIPATPARMVAGRSASPAEVRLVAHQLGLDRPLDVQYGIFLSDLLHGDLGTSYADNLPVRTVIGRRLGYTVLLALAGVAAEVLIGLPIGVVAAVKRGSALDELLMGLTLSGVSLPVFVTGFVLLYLFAFKLSLFPLQHYHGLSSVVLPALTLGLFQGAAYARLVRAGLSETLGQDYMRTARAKGLGVWSAALRHGLRSALPPVVTLMGLDLGAYLGGVVVVETVFGWPGVGLLVYQAIGNDDIPVIMGVTLISAAFVVLANLAVDLLYPLLDPRIQYR